MNDPLQQTLSEIVISNHLAAQVFENNGLDFCCRGKRTLQQACVEKGISAEEVLQQLELVKKSQTSSPAFHEMSMTELSEYIIRVHHAYVRQEMPLISSHLERVAMKHGDRFPYMKQVLGLFRDLEQDMTQHMMKEEKILFPRIRQLEIDQYPRNSIEFLQAPIDIMEEEHEHAGAILSQIGELTGGFASPEGACTTFRLSMSSIKAFEEDLHRHVHLENNILFPKAIERFLTSQIESIN